MKKWLPRLKLKLKMKLKYLKKLLFEKEKELAELEFNSRSFITIGDTKVKTCNEFYGGDAIGCHGFMTRSLNSQN